MSDSDLVYLMDIPSFYSQNIIPFFPYGVSKDVLVAKKRIADKAEVFTLDCKTEDADEMLLLPLYDEQRRITGRISLKRKNQTVDPLPMINNGMMTDIMPFIVLLQDADIWTTVHELCHLFSIGSYLITAERSVSHTFGLHEYCYHMVDNQLKQTDYSGHNGLNELLTDYAAWYILKKRDIFIQPKYDWLSVFHQYVKSIAVAEEDLIRSYFSGETDRLRHWLLNAKLKSYEGLYSFLFNKQN